MTFRLRLYSGDKGIYDPWSVALVFILHKKHAVLLITFVGPSQRLWRTREHEHLLSGKDGIVAIIFKEQETFSYFFPYFFFS